MVMLGTGVWDARLMVDNEESGTVTADLTITLSFVSAVAIMTLKSAIVYPFLLASSNDRIASTYLTRDSPICPT
ncbi:hypothetical protein TNCV_950291 [Trichonephila clavipes]|nr:hypothetical protein TNCV_950291 [Trichonephila clavipes]